MYERHGHKYHSPRYIWHQSTGNCSLVMSINICSIFSSFKSWILQISVQFLGAKTMLTFFKQTTTNCMTSYTKSKRPLFRSQNWELAIQLLDLGMHYKLLQSISFDRVSISMQNFEKWHFFNSPKAFGKFSTLISPPSPH